MNHHQSNHYPHHSSGILLTAVQPSRGIIRNLYFPSSPSLHRPPSFLLSQPFQPVQLTNSIISPLPPTPTPQQQADAAFARVKKTVGPLSQPDGKSSGFPTPPILKLNDINTAMAQGLMLGQSSEKPTPAPTAAPRTAPKDKEFLLGYLAGVARGAR